MYLIGKSCKSVLLSAGKAVMKQSHYGWECELVWTQFGNSCQVFKMSFMLGPREHATNSFF